jgi:tetratricopeptide (TPR) repeat protein
MRVNLILILLILFFSNPVSAESRIFVKEYNYEASVIDSKASSRILALEQVKRLLLEELETYLGNEPEVKKFQLSKDTIRTLTAGIAKTEIVSEKWDGYTYWLQAKIAADSGQVIKSIDVLRKDREKTNALEEVRRRSEELLSENERLRKEQAGEEGRTKNEVKKAYDKTIKELEADDWFIKGYSLYASGNLTGAIAAISKAIELNSKHADAYGNRGSYYAQLGKYKQAIKDCDRAIELEPKHVGNYVIRAEVYLRSGNYMQAIEDYNRALDLDPVDHETYYNRGTAYGNLGSYYNMIEDYKIAARLGSKEAHAYLKKEGIDW